MAGNKTPETPAKTPETPAKTLAGILEELLKCLNPKYPLEASESKDPLEALKTKLRKFLNEYVTVDNLQLIPKDDTKLNEGGNDLGDFYLNLGKNNLSIYNKKIEGTNISYGIYIRRISSNKNNDIIKFDVCRADTLGPNSKNGINNIKPFGEVRFRVGKGFYRCPTKQNLE